MRIIIKLIKPTSTSRLTVAGPASRFGRRPAAARETPQRLSYATVACLALSLSSLSRRLHMRGLKSGTWLAAGTLTPAESSSRPSGSRTLRLLLYSACAPGHSHCIYCVLVTFHTTLPSFSMRAFNLTSRNNITSTLQNARALASGYSYLRLSLRNLAAVADIHPVATGKFWQSRK